MIKFIQDVPVIKLEADKKWLDEPIQVLKNLQNNFKLKYKSSPIKKLWNKEIKSISNSLFGKSACIKEFAKYLKRVNKKKWASCCFYNQKLFDQMQDEDNTPSDITDGSKSRVFRKTKDMFLEVIKKHMSSQSHCIISVLQKFSQIFNKHYLELISKVKQLWALYNQWWRVTNGELGCKDWITK